MDNWKTLADSTRAYLIAPAGHGKTRLIAEAVAKGKGRRELILTHTHAGVDALRVRLQQAGADGSRFRVDTIAGWALRYASSFPVTSGFKTETPQGADWARVYSAATRTLFLKPIQEVLKASYSGVYVDEYQDCTVDQHLLIVSLSQILPCRVLGDPFQAIFSFRNAKLVNWKSDVGSHFSPLPELSHPWRWETTAPALGKWLVKVRKAFESGRPIDLREAPKDVVTWIPMPTDNTERIMKQLEVCRNLCKSKETIVAIHHWEPQCNKLVNSLAPMYGNIETVECKQLMASARTIDTSTGMTRVDAIVEFAALCYTGLNQELATILKVLRTGKSSNRKPYKRQAVMVILAAILTDNSLARVLEALTAIRQIPDIKLWRRELYYAMCQSLREYANGRHDTLEAAAWAVRNHTRHSGRSYSRRVVSRTLLVKGQEFDHAVILNSQDLDVNNLYVALTRGSRSLTVFSPSSQLDPFNIRQNSEHKPGRLV